jgi:nitrous oxidase accessory protein
VEIVGDRGAVLDGEGQRQIMTVTADGVAVRGLVFRDVGTSFTEDRAAIKVVGASDCAIEGNRLENAFFGIYLARVSRCRVVGNVLRATQSTEAASGNGIHLWTAEAVTIADNRISGHRDGIYFEFVHDSEIRGNLSEGNLRYGLHFMYSDNCRYRRNVFRRNGAGVAVMYTREVEMVGNRFEENWGSAAYGLLLKEIGDARIEGNRFTRNTTGLVLDGATRPVAVANDFVDNGWALRVDANTQDGRFSANNFVGNTFDVATNGRQVASSFTGNYWDAYGGYDLDRDGVGDVPHRPVRLFSMLVEQNEPSLILLRSVFVGLLDAAERVVPALTPEALADGHPRMRRIARQTP